MSEFWREKKVFVTGATGLIGGWLVRALLDSQAYVVVLVRDWDPQSELIRSGLINQTYVVNGQLEDYATLDRAINEHEIDTVFHLGAQTIVGSALRSPLPTFESNIRGTYNLMEACRVHDGLVKRVVVASSDKAYGDSDVLPYTEDMPLIGRHPYDVSKSCTDLIAITYHRTYGVPVAVTRCGNVYGGGDLNWSRIVPGTIRSFLAKEAPIIRSDGKFLRDYVYVKDVADAYMTTAEALDNPEVRGEAFNFAHEQPRTVLEVVFAISRLMGCDEIKPIILNQAKGEILNQYLDSTKAKTFLGWTAKHDFDQALGETIKWYREFLGA